MLKFKKKVSFICLQTLYAYKKQTRSYLCLPCTLLISYCPMRLTFHQGDSSWFVCVHVCWFQFDRCDPSTARPANPVCMSVTFREIVRSRCTSARRYYLLNPERIAVACNFSFPLPVSSRLLLSRPTRVLRCSRYFKTLIVRAPIAVLEVSTHESSQPYLAHSSTSSSSAPIVRLVSE